VYQLEKGNLGEEDVDSARGKNLSTSDWKISWNRTIEVGYMQIPTYTMVLVFWNVGIWMIRVGNPDLHFHNHTHGLYQQLG
jgi:hypothetical protein